MKFKYTHIYHKSRAYRYAIKSNFSIIDLTLQFETTSTSKTDKNFIKENTDLII